MMKKISILFTLILTIMLLSACDSKEVREAKKAYEEKDYTRVVKLLSEEEDLSEEAQDILISSEANIAYEKKDYAKVVEILSKEKDLSQESQDMLISAEANILFEKGEYVEAVKKIASSSKGTENEQYEEMFDAALKDSFDKHSADAMVELLVLDESKSDTVYKTITDACNNKDYNGFINLDGLVEKLPDGDLKTKLSEFNEEYKILRAESYMVGTWEWYIKGAKKPATVKVIPYDNNLVGRLVKVGSDLKGWHYQKDDVYWKDFEFESPNKFICYNLTRLEDGTALGETATGKINYEKGIIELNVTEATDPIRTWKRVNE